MAEPHLKDLQSIAASFARRADMKLDLECRRFFSGAAAYVDGKIFMTLTPVGLALKLPEAARASVLAAGGKPLRYFPNAPVKKEYVVLPEAPSEDALTNWISASIRYVVRA